MPIACLVCKTVINPWHFSSGRNITNLVKDTFVVIGLMVFLAPGLVEGLLGTALVLVTLHAGRNTYEMSECAFHIWGVVRAGKHTVSLVGNILLDTVHGRLRRVWSLIIRLAE